MAVTDEFVFVDGPSPTEAEHIYDHFFSQFQSPGFSNSHVKQIRARRARQDLQGVLFFDELLALALDQEVARVQSIYPPASGKEALLQLIEAISASSFDRIRRMALLYYVLFDISTYEHAAPESLQSFVKVSGLPRSMRYTMTGYWNLDAGHYRAAVSYLHQPDFVPRIAKLLNPIAYASTSTSEAEDRAFAFQAFLKVCTNDEALELSKEELVEARTISVCHTSGVRAAWLWSCHAMTPDGKEDDEQLMLRCVARIIEFCFMPQSKSQAVQSLIALPLTPPEEALLAHVIVNPPSNVSLAATAHATAIDVLIVRQINSGHYIDAVLLDRRVNASLGLMHLTGDASTGAEREKLRSLRAKRQNLIKTATAVLSRVERTLLELGDDIGAQDSTVGRESEEARSDDSWERVPQATDQSYHSIFAQEKGNTSLSASPALRSQKGTAGQSEDLLLTALARSKLVQLTASPKRFSSSAIGDLSSRSYVQSPNVRQTRGDVGASSSNMSRGSPAVQAIVRQETSIQGISSPLAARRPYHLESMNVDRVAESVAADKGGEDGADDGLGQAAKDEEMEESVGPMAKLAQQLEQEMRRNQSTMTDILRRSVSTGTSPFKVTGTPNKNAHATLTRKQAPRRYEARYEIGGSQTSGAVQNEVPSGGIEEVPEESPAKEVPRRRQARRAPLKATRTRKAAATSGETVTSAAERLGAAHEGDTSVPGSFPGMNASDDDDHTQTNAKMQAQQPISRRKTISSAMQDTTSSERPQRSGKTQKSRKEIDEEAGDVVPELTQTPNIRKSRSAASGLATRPKASTPLRRSNRLSVEPEGAAAVQDRGVEDEGEASVVRRKSTRSASPTKVKRSTTGAAKKEKLEAAHDEHESEPVMTRSSSRRKAAGF